MYKYLPLLLLVVACKTAPPPAILHTVETVETQATEQAVQIVEIEKTVEKIITLTDGEAKKEAIKLSGQVQELQATNAGLQHTISIMRVETESLVQERDGLQKETAMLRTKYTIAFRIALLLFAFFVLPKLVKLIIKLLV